MSPEIWKWIPDFEGLYQVSTWGRIRSVDRWVIYKDGSKRFYKGRILKPARDENGYLLVVLSRDGKRRNFRVHRLVAEAFIPNPENKPEVNHLDENKENNYVSNLEWSTHKDNINWGTRNERHAASMLNASRSNGRKPGRKPKPVQAINPSTGEVVLEFPSTREAERKGFNHGDISACCRGKVEQHKGLEWRYKES